MSEFEPPHSYDTLNGLFTRKLKTVRKFDNSTATYICPTDSFVSAQGDIVDNKVYQIKGMSYSLDKLLTQHIADSKLNGGRFMNLYLSPKDYHRYHSPYDFELLKLIHVAGKLYPVNFKYLHKKQNLFIENERVIAVCQTPNKQKYNMVFVGALNVGKMVFEIEPKIQTNAQANSTVVYNYKNTHIKKGECMGYFKMGSTVLMFWQKDMVDLENVHIQSVRYGDNIAKSSHV
jgi:phosphatidylserine decarboxylase